MSPSSLSPSCSSATSGASPWSCSAFRPPPTGAMSTPRRPRSRSGRTAPSLTSSSRPPPRAWSPACSRRSSHRARPMLAVRSHAAGEPLRLEELPLPEPSGTEVRLRVAGCGVCHTDLHIARTSRLRVERPITLGHEIAGWIDGAGPGAAADLRRARLHDGDAVAIFGGWGCGLCGQCLAGEEQRCNAGTSPGFQRDGGYAEYLLVPHARHLVAIGQLDPVEAAPLADAALTPWRAVQRAMPWLLPDARV